MILILGFPELAVRRLRSRLSPILNFTDRLIKSNGIGPSAKDALKFRCHWTSKAPALSRCRFHRPAKDRCSVSMWRNNRA